MIVTYAMSNSYISSETVCGVLLEFAYLGWKVSYGTGLIGLLSRVCHFLLGKYIMVANAHIPVTLPHTLSRSISPFLNANRTCDNKQVIQCYHGTACRLYDWSVRSDPGVLQL